MESADKPHFGKISTLVYATMFGDLQQVARDHGYALAVHGSMQRDFDLIAVPWTEMACDAEDLINAFICALKIGPQTEPEEKPHGRIAYAIVVDCGLYLDISVMPKKHEKKEKQDGD